MATWRLGRLTSAAGPGGKAYTSRDLDRAIRREFQLLVIGGHRSASEAPHGEFVGTARQFPPPIDFAHVSVFGLVRNDRSHGLFNLHCNICRVYRHFV